jgi:HTH domain.
MSHGLRKLSDDEIISQFEEAPEPVLTAAEIADAVDMTRQTANRRLKQLREVGEVEKKRVGSRAVVWWLAKEADAHSLESVDSDATAL